MFKVSEPLATSATNTAVNGVLFSPGAPLCKSESFASTLLPFNVPSSSTLAESSVTTGASLTELTVIEKLAVTVSPLANAVRVIRVGAPHWLAAGVTLMSRTPLPPEPGVTISPLFGMIVVLPETADKTIVLPSASNTFACTVMLPSSLMVELPGEEMKVGGAAEAIPTDAMNTADPSRLRSQCLPSVRPGSDCMTC